MKHLENMTSILHAYNEIATAYFFQTNGTASSDTQKKYSDKYSLRHRLSIYIVTRVVRNKHER